MLLEGNNSFRLINKLNSKPLLYLIKYKSILLVCWYMAALLKHAFRC